MSNFKYIATSSKLRRVVGFNNESEAAAQAADWEKEAPTGEHDAEAPATVYTWDEWVELAEANEVDPMDGIENSDEVQK